MITNSLVYFCDSWANCVIVLAVDWAMDCWSLHSSPDDVQRVTASLSNRSGNGAEYQWCREARNSHRVHCSSTRSHHRTWSTYLKNTAIGLVSTSVAIKVSTVPTSGNSPDVPHGYPALRSYTSHSRSYKSRFFFCV